MSIEYIDEMNNLGSRYTNSTGYYVEYFPPNTNSELINCLEAMYNDTTSVIDWFCYEIEFGKLYGKDGYKNYLDNKEFPIRNEEELYNYLIANKSKE